MASNIDINLVARTSDFETKLDKATKMFETLASKGTDANKALQKSFSEINKNGTKDLGDLQKAFNSLKISGDFGLSEQKKFVENAKRFYIEQFNQIKNSAKTSAEETARAWQGLKTTLDNINKMSGKEAKVSDYKNLQKAHEEALRLNEEFNYRKLQSDLKMQEEAIKLNQKFEYDKINNQTKMFEEALLLNQKFDYDKLQSQIKMQEEAIRLNQKFNYDKNQAEIKMLEEAIRMNQKFDYEKIQNQTKMLNEAYQMNQEFNYKKLQSEMKMQEEALLMNKKFDYDKLQSQIKMYEQAVLMDQERTHKLAQEAAKRAQIQASENAKFGPARSSFQALGMKSSIEINTEKQSLIAAFNEIKNSGVYSAKEINKAFAALKEQLRSLNGTKLPVNDLSQMNNHSEKMNMNFLMSLATIAKMQIMFSLINQTMSAIGSMPGIAVDAIEKFNAQIVGNAALITSMQNGISDVGEAYKKNKVYAEAVQNVLVKMDSETSASAKNLNDMNTQLIQQGIILDVNSEKQKESFKSIANALSAITANDPNKDMQFAQEIRALRDFRETGSNRFVQLLSAQGVTKEMLQNWKQISQETGNYGYVLEKIAPYLKGFAAAQGDINNLWETTKSTMVTIRDEVLRGGLSQGFSEIVKFMKELSKSAEENKDKIQAFLRDGFERTKFVAEQFFKLGKIVYELGDVVKWTAITAGIYSVVGAMSKLTAEFTLATGGMNLLLAGAASLGLLGGKKIAEHFNAKDEANAINNAFKGHNSTPGLKPWEISASQIKYLHNQYPSITPEQIISAKRSGAIGYDGYNELMEGLTLDRERMKKLLNPQTSKIEMPTNLRVSSGKTTASTSTPAVDNSLYNFNNKLNSYFDSSELDSYEKGLERINSEYMKMVSEYKALSETDKAWEDKGREGGTLGALERTKKALEENLKLKEQMKGESLLGEFEKFKNNGELDTLDKQLANIDVQSNSFIEKIQKASSATKEWLELKGVNKDNILKVFEEIKDKAKDAFRIKIQYQIEQVKNDTENIKNNTLGLFENEDPYKQLNNKYNEDYDKEEKEIAKLEAIKNRQETEEKLLQAHYDKLTAIQAKFKADKTRLDREAWEKGAESIAGSLAMIGNVMMQGNKKQFEEGKKMAKASIYIETTLGAIKAFTSMSGIPYVGWALGAAAAAAVVARGAAAASQVSSQSYEGREYGGPVTAGKSYIVGEKRPELFTPGATGVITPYVPEGGKGVEVTNVYQISTGVADTVRNEIARLAPALTQMSVNAVRNAIQNGEFNGAMA